MLKNLRKEFVEEHLNFECSRLSREKINCYAYILLEIFDEYHYSKF